MVKVTLYVLDDLLDPYNRMLFDGKQVKLHQLRTMLRTIL